MSSTVAAASSRGASQRQGAAATSDATLSFSMADTTDLAIVGGGAAGLATAIFAAEAAREAALSRRIVVIDGARMLGAKILVSGGGRCNVTHESAGPEDFNGSRPVIRNILAAFPPAAAVRWFASMGVELRREETGKLFPVTDSARTVLNALLNRCTELGIALQTDSRVSGIVPPGGTGAAADLFSIEHSRGTTRSARGVMATGGRSLPRSGSDGAGWETVRQLGHTVTPTCAALVPLVLAPGMFHASLAGIALDAELSTFAGGKMIDRRRGSLLWTHFGVSGPVVMDASRHWVKAKESGIDVSMQCNLLPPDGFEAVERWLIDLAASRQRVLVVNAVAARLPDRVAAAVAAHAGIDPATTCGQLSRPLRRALSIVQHRGWNYAEVTAGGVPLNEIDYRTMQSRKVPGLYLAGEILDCEGRIGGFNFQWAWATGYLAGTAAGVGGGE
jgi:predicted Rossmann fold flavoprotein